MRLATHALRTALAAPSLFLLALLLAAAAPAAQSISLPVTFEDSSVDYELRDFEPGGVDGPTSTIVADPTDATNMVVQTVRPATAVCYAGTTVAEETGFNAPVPFTADETTMSVRVWSPEAGIRVLFKVEEDGNPDLFVETLAFTTVADGWETMVFDFGNPMPNDKALVLGGNYNKVSIFFDFQCGLAGATPATRTYYWDDVTFGNTTGGSPDPANLISFGDFESLAPGTTTGIFTPGFTQGPAGTTYTIDGDVAYTGDQSLRINYPGGATNFYEVQGVATGIPITAGDEYTFSVWARTGGGDGAGQFAFGVLTPDYQPVVPATVNYGTAITGDWQEFTFTFTVPAEATYTTVNVVTQYGFAGNEGEAVYIDDLSLVATATSVPMVVINEVDADQVDTDGAEFVELFNAGDGSVDLSGHVLVFFNGSNDLSYNAVDLDGYTLAAGEYFVYCGDTANVPNCDLEVGAGTTNLIQNGADAVALVMGDGTDYPSGTAIPTSGIVDALVYGTNDGDDAELLAGLGQTVQYNDTVDGSIQRSPDGADTYLVAAPTSGAANATSQTFTALLRGENEVPAVETDAKGGVTAVLNGTSLTVSGTFAGLSGTFAAAHLHGAPVGVNGPVVVPLTATPTADMMGGSFEAASNTFTIRETFADSIRAGLVYVNVHSSAVGSGEIRGQLGTGAHALPFGLDGAQEVPPVTTDATGSGTVTVDGDMVTVTGSFMGLGSNYAASHIHAGAAGATGGVVVALTATVDGDNRGGTWEAASNMFAVRTTFADSLRAGLGYVNVHSASNPSGEIRGQVGTPAMEMPMGVVNGSFEDSDTGTIDINTDTPGWNLNIGEGAAATFEIVESGAQDGDKALKVSITAVGPNAWNIEASNEPVPATQGTMYTYSIWAKAETAGATAAFSVGAPPTTYTEYGAIRDNVTLTTEWQEFTFEFEALNDTTEMRAPVHFSYAANVGNAIYIDNLSIEVAPTVLSVADARAAGVGETVTIEGTVSRSMGAFTYLQDATGGLTVRQTSGAFFDGVAGGTIAPGTMLRVTGELSEFNQLLQINGDDLTSFEVLGQGDAPEPQTVTLSELATNGEDYEGELVTVRAVSFADAGTFTAATTYQVTDDSDATNAVAVRVPNASETSVDDTAIPPQANLTAVVGQFNGSDPAVGYQLLLIDASDVVNSVATEGDAEAVLALTVANPVRQSTTVRFSLDAVGEATVALYDALGRKVATLADGEMGLGVQTARLDAAGLASGVYVLRLEAETGFVTKTITVVR